MLKNMLVLLVAASLLVAACSTANPSLQATLQAQHTEISRISTQLASNQIQITQTNPPTAMSPISTETPIPEPASTTLIYHGVTTHSWSTLWGLTGQADAIKAEVDAYEAAAGRTVAWVGFAHEWQTDGRAFPSDVAISIRNRGATPLIFLNLRSVDVIDEAQQVESLYTLDAIISGQFDSDFVTWADGAKSFGSDLIVDWGWEMNGDWAPWNGIHNGGQSEGPQRFQQAYRHIIELMRSRGASNIRWAFHVNFPEYPEEPWNAFENYYPGDDVIDYVGVSIYGTQSPIDESFPSFTSNMDSAYSRLVEMAPQKPVFVFEFGTSENPLGDQAQWADDALANILSGRWPAVRSFAWWNDYWECWCQDGNPAHDTEMRVEVAPGLATVFKSRLSEEKNIGDHPPIFMDKNLLNHTTPAPLRAEITLKMLAEQRGIRFGSNYQYEFRGTEYDKIFETEMNAMTAGIFWNDGSHQSRSEFDFSEMDAKVNWGLARGMEVYGQTLVWFSEIEMPDWLKALPATAGETVMNEYIDTVVKRYAGKIKFWNVVNEAVNDGDSGTLRQGHIWAKAMGDDYIRKAFVRAHAADPNAILYYNEYDIESNKAKFDATKVLLINLKKQGTPVHALGWQMHVKPGSFDPDVLLARMNEIADLGFDNYITELDVELPENATAADYEKQKQTYKTVVETALKARRLKAIIVWGIRDGDTWWLTRNHHALLDENLKKKPAYFGIQEALLMLIEP